MLIDLAFHSGQKYIVRITTVLATDLQCERGPFYDDQVSDSVTD